MLIHFLRHARRRPRAVREQYALGIAGVFTGVVALVWAFALPDSPAEQARRVAEQENSAPPFSAFMSGIGEQVAATRDSLRAQTASWSGSATSSAASTSLDSGVADSSDLSNDEPADANDPILLSPDEIDAINTARVETSTSSALGSTTTVTPSARTRSTARPPGQVVLIATTSAATRATGTPAAE